MATNAIIPISNLDISKVSLGDIRTNKKGGKSVPIRYNGQNLQIRVPKAVYFMGVSIKEKDGNTSYTLSLTLKGCDPYGKDRASTEAGELGQFYNFINDIQELVLNTAASKTTQWFGKKMDKSVLQALMKQSISPSVEKVNGVWEPSGKYPPSLRMKVPVYDGEVSMGVVDQYGKPVEVTVDNIGERIPKLSEVSVTVAPSIYVSGQGFGITWRIMYARVCPPQRLTAANVFADEIEEEQVPASSSNTNEEEGVAVPTFEEDEQEQEERPVTPPPAPTPTPAAPTKSNRRRAVPSAV
jgi:hypothetical protein